MEIAGDRPPRYGKVIPNYRGGPMLAGICPSAKAGDISITPSKGGIMRSEMAL